MDEPPSDALRLLLRRRVVRLLELERGASGEAGALALSRGGRRRGQAGRLLGDGARAPHLRDDGAAEARAAHTRAPVPVRGKRRAIAGARAGRPLPERHAAVPHPRARRRPCWRRSPPASSVVCAPGFHAPSFRTGSRSSSRRGTRRCRRCTRRCSRARRTEPRDATVAAVRPVVVGAAASSRVYDELEQAFGVPGHRGVRHDGGGAPDGEQPASAREPQAGHGRASAGLEIAVLDEDGHSSPRGDDGEIVDPRRDASSPATRRTPRRTRRRSSTAGSGPATRASSTTTATCCSRGRLEGDHQPRRGEDLAGGDRERPARSPGCRRRRWGSRCPIRGSARMSAPPSCCGRARRQAPAICRSTSPSGSPTSRFPGVVVTVDELPTGPTGKVQRRESRAAARPDRRPALRRARRLRRAGDATGAGDGCALGEVLDVERVGAEDDFFALGGDSLLAAEVMARVADWYGRVPAATILMWTSTLRAFCVALEEWALGRRLCHRAAAARGKPPAALRGPRARGRGLERRCAQALPRR